MKRDSHEYYALIESPDIYDYGAYLQCEKLLDCQTRISELSTSDELQFQIVHQVEELWMKLMAFTLVGIMESMQNQQTHKVITLFKRVHTLQRMMITQLDVLETMSPKDYQQIRQQLGNGSGQESPGFNTLLKIPRDLWAHYVEYYLEATHTTIEQIYDSQHNHDSHYVIAEALIEFDELFQLFRWRHLFLIKRTIGMASKSLKGRAVEVLKKGADQKFFPELWLIREKMTDAWGKEFGVYRSSITKNS